MHLVENVAPVRTTTLASPRVSEAQALSATLAALPSQSGEPFGHRPPGATSPVSTRDSLYSSPTVERVAFLTKGSALKTGFMVETWSKSSNLLHETLVDQSGKVQAIELRTNTDKYNIFPNNPTATPQPFVDGPGIGSLESPSGWIFPGVPQGSVNISGNNVHATWTGMRITLPTPLGTASIMVNFSAWRPVVSHDGHQPVLPSRICLLQQCRSRGSNT